MSNSVYMSTYSYDVEVVFNSIDGTSTSINKEYVKYITVEHYYDTNVMPIMYMKINLPPDLYNKMSKEQRQSELYVCISKKKIKGSTSSTDKPIVKEGFTYYMSDSPDSSNKIDEETKKNATIAYKTCLLGLLKMDLQKKNQVNFEGVYKNTNSMSIIQNALKNTKSIIQPFSVNKSFSSIIIPPIPSVGQLINYIYQLSSFYNGSYVYYMDYDKTYLRSNDGSYIDAKDGDRKIIAFDIRDLTSNKALTTGMIEDPEQDAYIIYSSDADIIIDGATSENVNSVTTMNPIDGSLSTVSYVDTSKITDIKKNSQGMDIYKVSTDQNSNKVVSTRIAENSATLIISKIDVDSKAFTLNKQYVLSNYEQNPKYCGVYYLSRKQEIYLRNGDRMSVQVVLTLKKCADFI